MSLEVEVVTAIIGVVSSLVAALGSYTWKQFLNNQAREFKDKEKEKITEIGLDLGIINIKHKISDNVEPVRAEITNELINQIEKDILEKIPSSGLSKNEIRVEIEERIEAFHKRLENIESRFPEKDSIDKIASINDALFAERIEQLQKKIETIEKSNLTKWDVALVVSMVVAGIFAIVGATYAVLSLFDTALLK